MTSNLLDRYLGEGFVHVEGVFDAGEVDSATRSVERLPDWIRRWSRDRNIQRVQPLQSRLVTGNPAWITAFYDNPRLDRVIDAIFRGKIRPAPKMSRDPHMTGLLIEPLDRWWSTGLHRDYRDFLDDLDVDAWKARTGDLRYFNQINIPLLPDSSLWVIPGSHARDDREAEARLVRARAAYRDCRTRDADPEEVDALRSALLGGLSACGAVNVEASPGDLVVYRSNMLHCGIYEAGAKRLTLHDAVYSAEWREYAGLGPEGGGRAPSRQVREPARPPGSGVR